MKKNNSKKGSFVIGFGIGLCTVFWLSTVDAGETFMHEKAAVKAKIVALQDDQVRYDEEQLKKKLGVDSLKGADLSGANLRWIHLQEANLSRANLQGTNLTGTNLRNANLQKANLQGANLSRANLEGTDFRGADLTDVQNLFHRQIAVAVYDKETKFPESMTFEDIPKYNQFSLRSALGVKTLVGAEAQGMILRWGDFQGADMQWSSLQRTDLTGANLSGADLCSVDLRGADLREVKNMTIKQLAQAIVDKRTRLPESITLKQIE